MKIYENLRKPMKIYGNLRNRSHQTGFRNRFGKLTKTGFNLWGTVSPGLTKPVLVKLVFTIAPGLSVLKIGYPPSRYVPIGGDQDKNIAEEVCSQRGLLPDFWYFQRPPRYPPCPHTAEVLFIGWRPPHRPHIGNIMNFNIISIEFQQNYDTILIEFRQNFDRTSIEFRQNFDRISIEFQQNFDRSSVELRQIFNRISIKSRQNFDLT